MKTERKIKNQNKQKGAKAHTTVKIKEIILQRNYTVIKYLL